MKKALIISLLVLISVITFADSSPGEENLYGDGASFARLAEVEGTVNVYRDSYQLEKADTNLPLNPLDVVKTSPDSRAVIQFIDGTLLKMGEDTKVEFLEIDGSKDSFAIIVRMWSGKIYYDIADTDDFDQRTFRIDTKDATIFILQHGQYRIDKNSFETDVKVISGKTEVDVNDGAKIIRSGEAAVIGSDGSIQSFVFNTFDRDDFDLWAANTYKRKVVVSEKYVPAKIRHYVYELDSYGTWVYDDSVNVYVWRPYIVDTNWVPYSYGRWVWSPFGMTWVSYYPWGYAPFHYGYWNFSVSFGWVWVPDVWYSPAWVTWTYWDSYIGWYPCGYYRGRAITYPVRYRRRIVYAPVNRIYRGGIRYKRGPLPANRRVVTVRRPILPDPVVLRKNPREAIVRAIRKPVTRQVIDRRITQMKREARVVSTRENRAVPVSRVRDRTTVYRGNNSSSARVVRGRNVSTSSRRNTTIRNATPVSKTRSIKTREIRRTTPVIRNERKIERNNEIRNETPVIRENRTIKRNNSSSGGVSYRQKSIREGYSSVPQTRNKTVVREKANTSSSSTRTYRKSETKSYSSPRSSSRGNYSKSIRITPRSYSPRHSSGSSHRTIRRR